MAKITIEGRTYDLRLDVRAMKVVEKTWGDIKQALETFKKEKGMAMISEMFSIMANSGEKHAKRPMDVTEDVLDGCSLAQLNEISVAMNLAIEESMHAETVGGNEADDTVVDVYAQELEEREKNA